MSFSEAFLFFFTLFSTIYVMIVHTDGALNPDGTSGFCPRCGKCSWCKVSNQTVMGKSVDPLNKYPWMAALHHENGSFICGGAIISATYIVISAHCLIDFNVSAEERCEVSQDIPEDCFIPANTTEVHLLGKKRFTRRIKVKNIIPHGSYDQRLLRNDIALVELESPIRCNDRVFPICLPTRNFHKIGKNLLVVGWDKHWADQSKEPIKLKENWLTQYPPERCHVEDDFSYIDSTICTIARKVKRAPCMGDAGSVAAAKLGDFWFLLGITMFDVKSLCKTPYQTHIYVRIFKYVPWFVHTVEDLATPI